MRSSTRTVRARTAGILQVFFGKVDGELKVAAASAAEAADAASADAKPALPNRPVIELEN
jgi:hypothetical protein